MEIQTSPAAKREYLTKMDKLEAEIHKLSWLTVCEVNAGAFERAKKTAEACMRVQQEAALLTAEHFPDKPE